MKNTTIIKIWRNKLLKNNVSKPKINFFLSSDIVLPFWDILGKTNYWERSRESPSRSPGNSKSLHQPKAELFSVSAKSH